MEQEECTSSAEYISPVKVMEIEKNTLLQLLEKDPPSGLTFIQAPKQGNRAALGQVLQGHRIRARETRLAFFQG